MFFLCHHSVAFQLSVPTEQLFPCEKNTEGTKIYIYAYVSLVLYHIYQLIYLFQHVKKLLGTLWRQRIKVIFTIYFYSI